MYSCMALNKNTFHFFSPHQNSEGNYTVDVIFPMATRVRSLFSKRTVRSSHSIFVNVHMEHRFQINRRTCFKFPVPTSCRSQRQVGSLLG